MALLPRLTRDLHLGAMVLRSNWARLAHPMKISFAVTYRCNLRCGMCHIWKKGPSRDELNLREIDRFFELADGFSWVGLTGGEPFLREDLPEIVEAVRRRSRRLGCLHINTNGQLTERIVEIARDLRKVVAPARLIITVSVDGPPRVHDAVRGREGAWDRAVATFTSLKGIAGTRAQLGYTVVPQNLGAFGAMLSAVRERCPQLNFDDVNINVFQRSDFFYGNEDLPAMAPEELSREIAGIQALDQGGGSVNNLLRRRYLHFYQRFLASGRPPLRCQALSASCFLDPGGHLFPCVMHARRVLAVRDLDVPLRLFWKRHEVRRLSEECARHACPGCWTPCDAFSAIAGSLARSLVV
jgi:MoaA/NifB/PqqE/SkfB family radical SAM enzyme